MSLPSYQMKDIVTGFLGRKVTEPQLFRAIIEFDRWLVAMRYGKANFSGNQNIPYEVVRTAQGQNRLYIFLDLYSRYEFEKYGSYPSPAGEGGVFRGRTLFSVVDRVLDEVFVVVSKDDVLKLDRAAIVRLARWAKVNLLESAIETLPTSNKQGEILNLILNHESYYMVSRSWRDKDSISLAVPSKGQFLVACTAEDNLSYFVAMLEHSELIASRNHVTIFTKTGVELFQLARRFAVDGIIFNSAGPIAPTIFVNELLDVALATRRSTGPQRGVGFFSWLASFFQRS